MEMFCFKMAAQSVNYTQGASLHCNKIKLQLFPACAKSFEASSLFWLKSEKGTSCCEHKTARDTSII
jgi:hypothetical protein